ncbi:hypothetical protein [Streptomyces sporangiiformans]|uniref:Uncharacterized protein n=1 Tax=Streptomyces sporangiiformans TaxID=2315329 RepID=A0A505DMK5_9ACTN|nr:hypothetical protein [Streptomyces sporangiiformans]TPQ20661.1 hypothetical protein FGD71_019380 [Streptomyces sporangiiformans]
MTASAGTTRGRVFFGAVTGLAVAAGGVVAVLALVPDAPAGGLWRLAEWLLLASVAVWCAELCVARAAQPRRPGEAQAFRTLRLRTNGVLATSLVAELTLLTAGFARNDAYGTAWASGGVLLALLVGATARTSSISSAHSVYTPSDPLTAIAGFVLAELCGGWLTVRFAMEGPLWAAWGLGGAMVALALGFWLTDSPSSSSQSTYEKVFGSAAGLGVAGAVAWSTVRGETVAAWTVGGVAAGVLLVLGVLAFLENNSTSFALPWPRAVVGQGRTTSLGAQFAGVLVPLASVTWAVWGGESWSGEGSGDDRLLDVSYLAGAGAVLLVAQGAVLAWTVTSPPQRWMNELVGAVRQSVPGPEHDPYYESYAQRERGESWHRAPTSNQGVLSAAFHHLTHPLQSAAVITIHRRTALETGLAIDKIWPRIELVAPEQVKRQVRRREQGLLASRLVVASAVCTAGVWLFIALSDLGGFRLEGGSPALLVVGPLLVAAVALVQARRLLAEVYAAKADAVDVFRYDLATSLHLMLPENAHDMIRLASALSGDPTPYPLQGHGPQQQFAVDPGLPPGAQLHHLAADVADRLRSDLRADVRDAVREEYALLVRRDPARATLSAPDLAQLARDIAHSAAGPVSSHLKSHLTDLQQKFHQDVRATIRSSLEESVTGPPLTNFVGYLAIELDRRAQSEEQPPVRAEGGTIRATVGRRVNLVVSVVRDQRAQSLASVVASRPGTDFFVFEPVRVEGGKDARAVSFDAMADSSTLTPLPQRKNLLVHDETQTTFGFQMPEEEGSHEVWFQLYQTGHLVQVVALKIEAEAAPPPSGTGPESGPESGTAADGV